MAKPTLFSNGWTRLKMEPTVNLRNAEKLSMKAARWGNSLAIRLPASVVKQLDLKPGDVVDVTIARPDAFGMAKAEPKRINDPLLERVRALRGSLPSDYEFDRSEANAR
jgi:antitoxin MazE